MVSRMPPMQPVSVANHVKARQSLIERSELAQNLTNLCLTYFCIMLYVIRIKSMFDYRIFEHTGIFYALDTFIEIRRAVTWLATESGWAQSKRSAICSGKLCRGIIICGQCCPCQKHRDRQTDRHTDSFCPDILFAQPADVESWSCKMTGCLLSMNAKVQILKAYT